MRIFYRAGVVFLSMVLLLQPGAALFAQSAKMSEAERYYKDGREALAQDDFERAQKSYEALRKARPEIAEIHATLGAIYFQERKYSEALGELREAARLKPDLPKLDGLMAMSLAELGHYEEALKGLETTFGTATDAPVKRLSGLLLEKSYTALQMDAEAVGVALQLEKAFPEDGEVLYQNERIYGNYAFLSVQKLLKVAPNSVWQHQAQAEMEESRGAHDAAIAQYEKVLALDPSHLGTHYRIGRSLRERYRDNHHPEDVTRAMQEFESELKLDPNSANAAYEIGELHRIAGQQEEAKSYFERALTLYPDFPEANLGLGSVYASLHDPAKALPYLQRAIASDPEDETSWYRTAQVQRALGNMAEQKKAMDTFRALHEKALSQQMGTPHDVTRQELGAISEP